MTTTGPVLDPGAGAEPPLPPSGRIDPTRGNAARIWNYWLGGKDNYPMDRQVGDEVAEALPEAGALARCSRYFLARVIRCLASQGIEQFLDIGVGLPAVDNTHQIAQKLRPDTRVVYVDNDPLVLAHAHALLTCDPPGVAACIDADLRDPGGLLDMAAATLDFTRPIAVLLIGVLHFITDAENPYRIVRHLVGALPEGSAVAIAHAASIGSDGDIEDAARLWNKQTTLPFVPRTPQQVGRLFLGLDLIDPGVVPLPLWRPDAGPWEPSPRFPSYCGIARV